MREIKFRAWDKEKKKMMVVLAINMGCKGILGQTCDASIAIESSKGYPDYDVFAMDKIELMQYAGLKDSKGKEVYEGDILSNGEGVAIHSVCFINGRFCEFCKKGIYGDGSIMRNGYTEIIGNIYENPELLKETK